MGKREKGLRGSHYCLREETEQFGVTPIDTEGNEEREKAGALQAG